MKWALIITTVIVAAVWVLSVVTYPAHEQAKEKELKQKHIEEKAKGKQIYEASCATDCHRELNLAALGESSNYEFIKNHALYSPNLLTSQQWWDFLYKKDDSKRCTGIDKLNNRSKELLYVFLRDESADNTDNAKIFKDMFLEDLENGAEVLKNSQGREIFKQSCQSCHRDEFIKSFTSVEWGIKIKQLLEIHEGKEADLPAESEITKLLKYLQDSSAVNYEDAKIIRKLSAELRSLKSSGMKADNTKEIVEIPEEIEWINLDWKYEYFDGIAGLVKRFEGKPILLELTNRFN